MKEAVKEFLLSFTASVLAPLLIELVKILLGMLQPHSGGDKSPHSPLKQANLKENQRVVVIENRLWLLWHFGFIQNDFLSISLKSLANEETLTASYTTVEFL